MIKNGSDLPQRFSVIFVIFEVVGEVPKSLSYRLAHQISFDVTSKCTAQEHVLLPSLVIVQVVSLKKALLTAHKSTSFFSILVEEFSFLLKHLSAMSRTCKR